MKSTYLFLLLAFFGLTLSANGQSPQGINYQAVARDVDGKPLSLKDISVRISILQGGESGDSEYSEIHQLRTNQFGLFTLVIGAGDVVSGDFQFISWAIGGKWLRVELDSEGNQNFQLMGSQQLMSVPYAFYAQYSGNSLGAGQGISIVNSKINNTGDADNDPGNELITDMSLGGDNRLRITDAGGTKEADLSSLVGAQQNLGNVLATGNDASNQKIINLAAPTSSGDAATKAYVDAHTDPDADPANEIQDLNLNGNTLRVTNNTTATPVDLASYLDNTDSQMLSLTGASLAISNGNDVDLSAIVTDNQSLTLTGNTLGISGGNDVDLSSVNTDSQNLALSGTTLSIDGGNNVDLSGINTDAQNLTLSSSGTNRTIDIDNGAGVTIDVADNDNDPVNEIQDLVLNANILGVTNNASATNIDLAPYLDNTDAQTLSYNSGTRELSVSGGNTVTIPETQNLNQVLAQGTDAGAQQITNLGSPVSSTDAATKEYVDNADAALLSMISTTYAFKTAFQYTNTNSIPVNDSVIPFTSEEFDDFNVLGSNSFTASETGVYAFTVDGSYTAGFSGGQLSILVNGVKYSVAIVQPWGGSGGKFNATMMFKLNAGQTVSLVGDNVLVGGIFSGNFYGFKL